MLIDSTPRNINDYCIYYNRTELREMGKTELLVDHYLLIKNMLDDFNYSEVMTLLNPLSVNIKSIKDMKVKFIEEKVLPEIEKQLMKPIEYGTKRKYFDKVLFDGDIIFTEKQIYQDKSAE